MISTKEVLKKRKILNDTDISMAAVFKVLSDVNRYRIFRILIDQPELSVGNIAEILKISLPLTSQHIKVLVNSNLVQKQRAGKKVFPKVEHNNPFVKAVIKIIKQALK